MYNAIWLFEYIFSPSAARKSDRSTDPLHQRPILSQYRIQSREFARIYAHVDHWYHMRATFDHIINCFELISSIRLVRERLTDNRHGWTQHPLQLHNQ